LCCCRKPAREGVDVDEHVKTHFAWIESGDELGKAQFFQKESIKYQIGELFDSAVSKASNVLKKIELWRLSDTEAAVIKEKTNLDVSGYAHVIDNYAINHMLKEHGDANEEAKRGQIAITKEDMQMIPEVISSPDIIEPAGKTRQGLEGIKYGKKVNGFIIYVEEVRTGNKELAPVSMYKKAATPDAPSGKKSPAQTPEAFRSLDNSNLPSSDESVNRLSQAQFFQKESIKYQIGELFDYAVSKKENVVKKIMVQEVNTQEADILKQATNYGISEGYKHTIDNYAINHILKQHSDAKTEAERGQLPITKEDILLIPEIVSSADKIEPAGKSGIGRDTILYVKRVNGVIYYFEEVLTKQKELAAKAMRKIRATNDMSPAKETSSNTSETLRPDNNILPLSSEDSNIFSQAHNNEAKGAVQFLEDGRAVIHAFEKADISTVMHELAHVWRRDLKGDDLRIVEKWAGVQDGIWDRIHDETFAKGFERYLAEGKAPSEELKGVFEQFKTWILDIYRRLVYDDVWRTNLNPDVRKVFDRLFVESELPLKKAEHPETIEARKVADDAVRELNDIIKHEISEEITTVEDWGTSETV